MTDKACTCQHACADSCDFVCVQYSPYTHTGHREGCIQKTCRASYWHCCMPKTTVCIYIFSQILTMTLLALPTCYRSHSNVCRQVPSIVCEQGNEPISALGNHSRFVRKVQDASCFEVWHTYHGEINISTEQMQFRLEAVTKFFSFKLSNCGLLYICP